MLEIICNLRYLPETDKDLSVRRRKPNLTFGAVLGGRSVIHFRASIL
jgi:hypothetical protein